ncbi:short-chain dehydrogenase [Amylostereum chailletii]|nr:short-chain dehydrogenase [Amylostereum chailletii]
MGRLSFLKFLTDQWEFIPAVEPQDITGKTVLVVGANVGLGFEAARHLAAMSPGKLILTSRDLKKGDIAAEDIRKDTGFQNIAVRTVDLCVFSSVVEFVEEFERQEERLDILLHNAGMTNNTFETTTNGWEVVLQVNAMSCMLLCVSLLPLMLKTAAKNTKAVSRPRIVVVSSDTHYWCKFTPLELASANLLGKLNDREHCSDPTVIARRYTTTKLLNVFFVRELAERLSQDPPVIVNAVNPGLCHSKLRRDWGLAATVRSLVFISLFARTTEVGSRTLVWAATAAGHRERDLHGGYVSTNEVKEVSDFALSEEGLRMQGQVWDEMTEVLGKVSPRFKAIVNESLRKKV